MTRDTERLSGLLEPANEPALEALDRAYTTFPPPSLREAMDQAVHARMSRPRPVPQRHFRLPSLGRLLLPALAALLLATGGLVEFLSAGSPAPVSAQSVLRRAAAVRLPPNSASHLVYRVSVTVEGPHSGIEDTWIESDAAGNPIATVQTLTLSVKNIFTRYVQTDGETYAYNPELRNDNTIAMRPEALADPSWLVPNHMFDGATVARYLNAPDQQQEVQRLPDQTLDGHAVDVVQVDGGANRPALRTTLYFDAYSYVLRGFDTTSIDSSYPIPTWQVRLTSSSTTPAAAVPAHTFTLNAPADASIQLPAPDFAGFTAVFQTTCHTTLSLKQAVGAGSTPLVACRQTNPSVTEAQLVTALAVPVQRDLDAARAAGQISSAQETNGIHDLQLELTTLVTTSRSDK
jgi:hypothetical protein